MSNQFSIYKALHAETCKVVGSNCALAVDYFSFGFWWGYLWWIGAALALFLYVRSGFAAKVGAFAERRTERLWLQALVAVVPPVLACTSFFTLRNIWSYSQEPDKLTHLTYCPKLVHFPDKIPVCVEGPALWWTFFSGYVLSTISFVLLAALCAYGLLRIFQYTPKRFWLLPALAGAATLLYQSAGIDTLSRSQPLPADNALVKVVAPLAIRESWPLDRIHISRNDLVSFYNKGSVVGLGPGQRIVFGPDYALGNSETPEHVLKLVKRPSVNGFLAHKPSPAMLRAIMGHELAHVRRWHLELLLFGNLVICGLLCWLSAKALAKTGMWSSGWTALPIYLAALLAAVPLHSSIGRTMSLMTEYDADWAGLDISREPDGMAEFSLVLAAGAPLELPLIQRWVYYHPSHGERIRTAIAWQEEHRPNLPLIIPDTKTLLVPAKPTLKTSD